MSIFLFIVILYVLIVWGVIPLVVPHLGVRRKVCGNLSPYWDAVGATLQASAHTNDESLVQAYQAVTARHHGGRLETITKWWWAFRDPFMQAPGFMHCTGMNVILRTLLLRGGRFQEEDVRMVLVPLNFFIHQYLRVRVHNTCVDVDPWAKQFGVPFGARMAWFG